MPLHGKEPGDPSVCEECDDVAEAEEVAADYGRILEKLMAQRELIDE